MINPTTSTRTNGLTKENHSAKAHRPSAAAKAHRPPAAANGTSDAELLSLQAIITASKGPR